MGTLLDRIAGYFVGNTRAHSQNTRAHSPNARAHMVPTGSPGDVEVSRALSASLTSRYSGIRQIRMVLARASRAEDQRGGYYTGMLNRVARDRVGTGPKLRVFLENEEWNRILSLKWSNWVRKTRFAANLTAAIRDTARDGATFGVKFYNPGSRAKIKLDVRFVDSLRISSPWEWRKSYTQHIDGIDFDDLGNPIKYYVDEMNQSETDFATAKPPVEYKPTDVIHYFTKRSSEQVHGLPEASAGLLLYPNVRRYVNAVIKAAESHASTVYTLENTLGNTGEYTSDPFACIPIEPNMIQELPAGYKLNAMNPTQPGNNHDMLIHSVVGECSACFEMPLIMAIGSSAGSNFSSANFDVIPYEGSTKVHRRNIGIVICDDVFSQWYEEAIREKDYLPQRLRQKYPTAEELPFDWGFDRIRIHADPLKEAAAKEIALKTGERTLLDIWEENGGEMRPGLEAEAKALGIPFEEYARMILNARFGIKEVAEEGSNDAEDEDADLSRHTKAARAASMRELYGSESLN